MKYTKRLLNINNIYTESAKENNILEQSSIPAKQARIKEIEAEKSLLIQSIKDESVSILSKLKGDKFKKIISYVYWNKIIEFSDLRIKFNLTDKELRKNIRIKHKFLCWKCREAIIEDYIVSFAAFNGMSEDKFGDSIYLVDYRFQCTKCNPKQKPNLINPTLTDLKEMSYQDYLFTNHWRSVRLSILERDEYQCLLCPSTEDLHVHHISYEHRGEEQKYLNDLATLCKPCHIELHNKMNQAQKAQSSPLMIGAL